MSEFTKLAKVREAREFYNLTLYDENDICKKEVIIQLFKMLKADSGNANLEKLNKTCKFGNRVGRKSSKNINKGIIYSKSVTGLKEDRYEF